MAGHRRLRTREILSDRYELTEALDRRVPNWSGSVKPRSRTTPRISSHER
jgi:hypothetical protein